MTVSCLCNEQIVECKSYDMAARVPENVNLCNLNLLRVNAEICTHYMYSTAAY
jgi:hypothetical protein